MIRIAEEKDRAALLHYLGREPEFNLFIIGDIQHYGVRSEEMEVFIEARRGTIDAALMRFRNNFVPCSYDARADLSALAGRLNTRLAEPGRWFVSGRKEVIDRVLPLLRGKLVETHDQVFSVCREPKAGVPLGALSRVSLAAPDAAGDLLELWGATLGRQGRREDLARDIEQGDCVAIVREAAPGRIVSAAAAVAESDSAAMIVGVATHPEHRGKGYASACVWRLVSDLRARGKSACLFFDDPAAGSIYHRLGFADIGLWKMLKFEC
jgi:uncharacterized protein